MTLALVAASAAGLVAQAGYLRVAKSEAFDSIIALSQARAVSDDANADDSRYLVDPARAGQYQRAFESRSQQLVRLPGAGIFQYDAALARALSAYRADHADVRFGGYFGIEFHNITFAGERAAAEKALAAYQVYERDDRHIRTLNRGGKLRGRSRSTPATLLAIRIGPSPSTTMRWSRSSPSTSAHSPARSARASRIRRDGRGSSRAP